MVARKRIDGAEAARIMYGGSMLELKILEELKKEFPQGQVTFRPGKITSDGTKGLPLAYIDARDVMDRLDSVLGVFGWKDEYEFHGTRTICKISIFDSGGNGWISKSDGAGDTNIEGEKGGLSDAFKRAAVKWGIGRYLYDLSFMYAPVDKFKKFTDSDFDLWKYQIKKGMKPKAELTAEQKKEAASKKAQEIITEYKVCKDLGELSDIQTKYHGELKRFSEGYGDIFSQINTVGLQVIASFDQ